MFQQTPHNRVLFPRAPAMLMAGLFVVFSILSLFLVITPRQAVAATNNTVSFQARLENSAGAIVPDGFYNVQVNLYDVSTGGSTLWTEYYMDFNGTGPFQDTRVEVKNGYISINLGQYNAFPSTIKWDQDHWITMNIGGTAQTASPTWDGEMNPRLKLTGVPYAFRAGQLATAHTSNGFTSTLSILQPTVGNQTFQIADQGAAGTYTVCVQNSTSCGFAPTTGGTGYIQNQNAAQQTSSNFWISGTGRADVALQAPSFDTPTAVSLNIGTTNATSIVLGKAGVNTRVAANLSVGTTQSSGAINIANGAWLSGVDAAGTGSVNMFSVNSDNQIQVGAALNIDGGIVLPTNGGQMTLVDLGVDSSASAGAKQSYTLRVGSVNALTVYGEADGSGNAQNVRVAVGSSINPAYTLDVAGDINISSGSVYRINGTQICSSTGCTIASGSANYIQNQNASPQTTANFNISGIGTAATFNATTGINTGAGAGTQRIDASGNLTSIGTITASGNAVFNNANDLILQGNSGVPNDAGDLIFKTNGGAQLGRIWTNTSGSAVLFLSGSDTVQDLAIQDGSVDVAALLTTPTLDTATATTLNIATTNATAVNVATNSSAHTIAVGTGAGIQGITIGSTNSSSSLLLQSGTGNLQIQTQGGTLGIGNNSVAQTLNIGNTTGATSVNVAAGSGGINLNQNVTVAAGSSTTAFRIQSAANTSFFTADATNKIITTQDLNVGNPADRSTNRIFSDGFESGNFNLWSGGSTGAISVDSASVRGGKYAAKLTMSSSVGRATSSFASVSTVYARAYVNLTSKSTDSYLYYIGNTSSNFNLGVYWENSTGKICVWNEYVVAAAGCTAASVSTGAWHKIEIRATVGTPGTIVLTVDGTQAFSMTSQNVSNNFDRIAIGEGTSRTATFSIDDVTVDTITTGDSASLNINDSLHVAGTSSFGGLATFSTGRAEIALQAPSFDIATAGTLSIGETNATTVNIATNASAHTIAIGSGAAVQGITIGSTNGASSLLLQGGTGNLQIQTQGGTLGIGNNGVAQTLSIGNTTGATIVNITAGTGGINLNQNVTVAAGKYISLVGGISGTRPASPTEGMLYFDSTTKQLLTYANGKWKAEGKGATKIVAASNSSQAAKDSADYVADGNAAGANNGDQVEINDALTAAAGGRVYLLEGTYVADATILVPNNTALVGAGRGTLIELADLDTTDNLIEGSDATTGTGVVIQDLRIDGRSDLNTAGTQYGISFINMGGGFGPTARQGGKIINVTANRFRTVGIRLTTSHNNVVSGNTAQDNLEGIQLFGSSNNSVVGNVSQGNSAGIYLDTSDYNTVSSNSLEGNTSYAFNITNSSNNTLTGNIMNSNVSAGVFFDGSDTNTFSGNKISNSGAASENNGVTLFDSDSNSITSNNITDTSATTTNYAIYIVNSASDTNYLADNTLGTGSVQDAGTGTIYANQISGSGVLRMVSSGGVYLQASTNSTTAFQMVNSNSVAQLTVDTTLATPHVYIGPVAGDTVGTELVLGKKTNAGDPTGVAGAMYYNSSGTGAFRCYENGAWRNCLNGTQETESTVPGPATAIAGKAANATIIITPIYLSGQMTINEMRFNVTGTVLGAAGDIGLYNSAGTLVLNGGANSLTTAIGLKTVTPTQAGAARILEAGQYYMAVTWNSTTGNYSGAVLPIAGMNKRTGTIGGGGTTLPASLTLSGITTGVNIPAMSVNN